MKKMTKTLLKMKMNKIIALVLKNNFSKTLISIIIRTKLLESSFFTYKSLEYCTTIPSSLTVWSIHKKLVLCGLFKIFCLSLLKTKYKIQTFSTLSLGHVRVKNSFGMHYMFMYRVLHMIRLKMMSSKLDLAY